MLKVVVVNKEQRFVRFAEEYSDVSLDIHVNQLNKAILVWYTGYITPALKKNMKKYFAQACAIILGTKETRKRQEKKEIQKKTQTTLF